MDVASGDRWYQQIDKSHWYTLLGAWLGWALDAMDFLLITFVLTDIGREFDLSLTVMGTLVLATFLTRWLGGALFGSIADRFGRKNAMLLSVLTFAVATCLCGFAWNYWSLFAFRMIVGLGMAGEYSAGCTLLMEAWPERVRNKASGLLVSGYSFGGLLASLAYLVIFPHFGWRGLFFFGLAPAVLTIFIRFFVQESEEWLEAKKAGIRTGVSFFALFSKRWFMTTVITTIFLFAASGMNYPILALLPTYLKSVGYDPGAVGSIMSFANIGGMLGFCASGFLADLFGLRRAVVGSLVISLGFLALAFAIGQTTIILLGVLMFLLLFTNLGITGLWPRYVTRYFDAEVRSAGLGVSYNVGSLAGGISPVLGGALEHTLGLGAAISVLVLVWTIVVVAIVAFDIPGRVTQRRQVEAGGTRVPRYAEP